MSDRSPLSYRDLKTIQEGHRRNADVLALLREIKRMRTLLARTYAMIRKVPMSHFAVESEEIAAVLDGLKAEPSVQEHMRALRKLEELEFRRKVAQEPAK